MDSTTPQTFIYAFFAGLTVVTGWLLKHYAWSMNKAIDKLGASVDSVVAIISKHEADHQVFSVKFDHTEEKLDTHADRLDEHEERIDLLESKVK